ncbi:MAG: ABC transporter ATP-binding protein [Methyloligellaceae bacterium]
MTRNDIVLFRRKSNAPGATSQRSWGPRGTAAATIASRLTFEHVSRRYGPAAAVSDITLDVPPGEILCLLGPSGCGKTTLLRLAAGVERPTAGRILLDEQEVAGPERYVPPERRGIGLMFQDFALFPHLTIVDNVAFGLKELSRSEARLAAGAALERVGLGHYADDYPHILSGGEQQRVALARAIVPRPSVLLMDEPFSGLDSRLRDIMREETLAILRETRATCMIVTHAPEEAMRMGHRIALMRDGRLIQVGTAEALYHAPVDIDAARMFSDLNEIACRVTSGKVETALGVYDANGLADGAEALLCLRQRDVRIVGPEKGHLGRVLAARFLGDFALLEIGVEGLDEPLLVRVRESKAAKPGTEVGVEIDTTDILVFEPVPNGPASTVT